MKFRIQISVKGEKPYWEEYDKPISDADLWAKKTIKSFNDTLRLNEKPRTLHAIEVLDVESQKEHAWTRTNITTISDQYGLYDKVKCENCGITGKRYGLGEVNVQLDAKYRNAKVFRRCDTAAAHVAKKTARRMTKLANAR